MVVPLSNEIYAQGCMEVHRGVWRYAVVHRWVYIEVGVGVQRNTEVAQRYAGCTEVHVGMCTGTQEVHKGG